MYLIAIRTHGEGTWLNDEASYFLSTEALMPSFWNKALTQGLDHLNGNGYLGLTAAISLTLGRVDSLALRFANATLWRVAVCFLTPGAGLGDAHLSPAL